MQVQMLGPRQAPQFGYVHTGTLQLVPLYPDAQEQVSGPTHVPFGKLQLSWQTYCSHLDPAYPGLHLHKKVPSQVPLGALQ